MSIIHEGLRILEFVFRAFVHMLPFLIVSIIIATGFNRFRFKERMVGFLRRRVVYAILISTVIGATSPLCSCGVIPTLFTLLQVGVPLAPIMSFWITSPIMSPEAFVITWGNLGIELALVRLAATFVMGMAAGFVTSRLFSPTKTSSNWLKLSLAQGSDNCGCPTELNKEAVQEGSSDTSKLKVFLKDLKRTSVFLGSWLTVAFLLEAVITFYFPSYIITTIFGDQNSFSVLWAALIGIPLYINNISAIPIVNGLLQAGMSKGAALAFLLAGPVTAIPAMIAVFGLVKRKVFITFLLLGLFLSIMCGFVYEFVLLF